MGKLFVYSNKEQINYNTAEWATKFILDPDINATRFGWFRFNFPNRANRQHNKFKA